MHPSSKPWEKDPIEYLVRVRFPEIGNPPPTLAGGVGDFDTVPEHRLEGARKYRSELQATTPERISILVQGALLEQKSTLDDPLGAAAGADFVHHAKLAYWTPDEAIALSMGKAPSSFDWDRVRPFISISRIAQEYARRREIVERARVMGQLWKQTIPGVFVAWARRTGFEMHPSLVKAVTDLGVQIRDWKTAYDEKDRELSDARAEITRLNSEHINAGKDHLDFLERMRKGWDELSNTQATRIDLLESENQSLAMQAANSKKLVSHAKPEFSTRERQSLLKLALGMAMTKFRYLPDAAKNSATANIAADLRELGIPLDEDTIRKYLSEARELLP